MNVVGQEVIGTLFPLPRVSLFHGPHSVGKWTTAEWVRFKLGVSDSDILRVKRLLVADASLVSRFAATAPTRGTHRLVILNLDLASRASMNHLLKTLEESPETTYFILISTGSVSETILSRVTVFPFHLLTDASVATILTEKKKFKEIQAESLAYRAGGQVRRALAITEAAEAKPLIMQVLKAFREKDLVALEKAADGWTDRHTEFLSQWSHEAMTGRWKYFQEEEAEISGPRIPMTILAALRQDVRPRLVVRASLMSALRGMM